METIFGILTVVALIAAALIVVLLKGRKERNEEIKKAEKFNEETGKKNDHKG